MVSDSLCYLCGSRASIEKVPGEGGHRFDVLCDGDCPQYDISRFAIEYLAKHPIHQKGAVQSIVQIAASGRFPVVRVRGNPHQLCCTSREDEAKDKR